MAIETRAGLSLDTESGTLKTQGEVSRYVKYLPGIYSGDDFTSRFLSIFESVNRPIENTIDSLPSYFEPNTAPEIFLNWLGEWLNLALLESIPVDRRRSLLRESGKLFKWKGTNFGLTSLLELYTGLEVRVEEQLPSFDLSGSARLGNNTILGDGVPYSFLVSIWSTLENPPIAEHIHQIIRLEKPANTTYKLEIIRQETE